MSQLTVQSGLIYLATQVNNQFANWVMGLTNNTFTPTPTDTVATYAAIEATFPGYVRQPIANPPPPSIDVSGFATTLFPSIVFTCTSPPSLPEQEFGWFLVDTVSNKLLAAGLFTSPQTVTNAGDVVIVSMSDSAEPA